MTPEELIDEVYETWGEYFEVVPQSQHKDILIGIFTKMIISKTFEVEYLKNRLKELENAKNQH